PMWDLSKSGQWMHLASVYDPVNRIVSHHVNGERLSTESIEPEHLVRELHIGNGEIGNWGQPFRKDPSFAIRNLNGRIDELAILNAALTPGEIKELFLRSETGHP
ncbi:MAG: LamG-like jellyroll fold domain-containing protein, partial [Verrucomicrobiota bacterium]